MGIGELRTAMHDHINELRIALREYSRTAVETDALLRRFGGDLLQELRAYLSAEETLVFGVPPHGAWEVDQDYRDAAFSTYHRKLVTLDPVELGVSIRVDDVDGGHPAWIRVVLTLWKAGDKIHVSIGDRAPMAVPLAYEGELSTVCEMTVSTMLKHYREPIEHEQAGLYGRDPAIGFRLQTGLAG